MTKRLRTVATTIVEFIALTERRRLLVVAGVPVVLAALLYEVNMLGTAVLLLAAGVAAFLYTRPTAQKTVAAGAYATGVVLIGLVLLLLYWNWAQAGTAAPAAIVAAHLWWVVTGTVLIGLGLWLRQTEL
ncbi:hypothetical protein [Halosegnis marinus]|uniref:Uncharacterized protein n=1 Tax=Halosegnis marinus TaxID=3034023 RepID=A0ABD5ZS01_9EURY|nr:hypothetical protein [Halosegnis sp. DT85]